MAKPSLPKLENSLGKAFQEAIQLHQAGKLDKAERVYRRILKESPRHPDANHNLGVLHAQSRRPAQGLVYLKVALDGNPSNGQYRVSYIQALIESGQFEAARHALAEGTRAGLGSVEAEALAGLLKEPGTEDVNRLVGLFGAGRYAEGQVAASEMTRRFPDSGFAWKALGALLKQQGKLEAACPPMQKSVKLLPSDSEAHANFGAVLMDLGRHAEAEASYRMVLELRPNSADAHYRVGIALEAMARLEEAEASLRKALEFQPVFADAHNSLGVVLARQGRRREAERCYRKALELRPGYAEAHNNLGVTLNALDRWQEAEECIRRAIALNPRYAEAHNNLGVNLDGQNRQSEAVASYRTAVELKPDFAQAHCNLGVSYKNQGRIPEALASLRKALEIRPDFEGAYGNLLFALNYDPTKSADEIHAAYREYDDRFGRPLHKEWRPHRNSRELHRRLRVGYVSPDFRQHSVRHFLEPLLANHDKRVVEVFAYAELEREDIVTARYRAYADHWVSTRGMTDAALVERIRADGIDILVDLAGHTSGNRLRVFARKPAPVSISWLGCGCATGLSAIDYYLTDEICSPSGVEHLLSESSWRLETPGLVFRPAEGMGPVSTLPARSVGHVTFTTLTRAERINDGTVHVWSRILRKVDGSRLVIDSKSFRDAETRSRLVDRFAACGIDEDRLTIGFHSPPWDVLRRADIGLDCFPHNSGTTLLETLFMGLPFVTLADRPSVGRIGSSILHALGHPEWIAGSEEEYVDKAVGLAGDIAGLETLRSGLRDSLDASPLRDEAGFARRVEAAYRQMFADWVGERLHEGGVVDPSTMSQGTAAAPLADEQEKILELFRTGRHAEGEELARAMVDRFPAHGFGWKILGALQRQQGKLEEARSSLRTAAHLSPDDQEVFNIEGAVLVDEGRLDDAVRSYRRALELRPDYAEAWNNLGVALRETGRLGEAEASLRRALEARPEFADALLNLGIVLDEQDRFEEAESSYRHALVIRPDSVDAHCNLGEFLRKRGRPRDAEACHRRALHFSPDSPRAHRGLSIALAYLSDFDEVLSESDEALRLKGEDERIWEGRLYTFSYHPDLSAEEIYGEFVRWGERFPEPVVDFSSHDRNPGRRLRVGYVSPDFRNHTSRFYFLPLFANHDHAQVELYAYSNVLIEDEFTGQFKRLFDHWRNIRGVPDEEVARRVREDGIDILVDCCNHMQDHRLGVFTLKPAPVQATWLGAAWTTGLKMVDYVLFDPYLAPEGTLARETIVRLPHFFVAYLPPETTAEVVSPPCLKNGHVTFGYSGRTERLNHRTFRVWGEILRRLPDARLVLDYGPFADPPTQEHYRGFMAGHGVDVGRVVMRRSANIFEGLNDVDILLDCFPHSGGTMLFDALWMGVPVLTLASRPPVGRIGTSLMMNLGLPEWVAHGEEEYIGKACGFAGDRGKLAELRAGMRERMRTSPVMDGQGFARGVEAAYRKMWLNWSGGKA